MPTYDYHCPANGRTVEVKHAMSEKVRTWGELCALAGLSIEATPAETPAGRQAIGRDRHRWRCQSTEHARD